MQHLQIEPTWILRGETEGDGRTLEGRIVPYGDVIELSDGPESFARGVFADTEPASVSLLWQHDTKEPIGRMTELSETDDGAYGTFRLANTQRAREAAELIRDGIISGLSVGFEPDQITTKDGVRTHRKARLVETSLVTFAAYKRAEALAVRGEGEDAMADTETIELVEPDPVPDVRAEIAVLREEQETGFREMRSHMANLALASGPDPVKPMSVHAAFGELLKMVAEDPHQNRALADVIGTSPGNASGLIRDAWNTELIGQLNTLRPLFSAAGTVTFPSTGYGIAFPKITTHTQVAKRTAEKAEAATREAIIAAVTFPMEWFAGAVDVSMELLSQSDPSVREVIASDLLDQYAVVTEAEFAADVVAAATAGGAALPTATWAAFSAAVIGESAEIRAATGAPGDRLALTTASWMAVVGLLNPSAPAVLPSAGAPDFTAESFDVKGVAVFHAPALASDVLFNTKSLRKAERSPEQVSATNVALMGQDIGIIGATIALPLYPTGIHKFTV